METVVRPLLEGGCRGEILGWQGRALSSPADRPNPLPTNPELFQERRPGHGEYAGGGCALAGTNGDGVSFEVGVMMGSV